MSGRLVFICSPLRATAEKTMEQHIAEARYFAEIVRSEGDIPVVPHLWLQGPLDDTDERQRSLGMAMGRAALLKCDAVAVFGGRVSSGMAEEIKLAKSVFLPIEERHDVQAPATWTASHTPVTVIRGEPS